MIWGVPTSSDAHCDRAVRECGFFARSGAVLVISTGCHSCWLPLLAASCSKSPSKAALAMAIPVTLHIYHVSTDSRVGAVNEYLEAMGTGAFHAGVEVNGKEWSYGYSPDGSGVFSCSPKGCKAHVYKDSLEMGECQKSSAEIEAIIQAGVCNGFVAMDLC